MIDDIQDEEWLRAGIVCYMTVALAADGIIRSTAVRPGEPDRCGVARSVWTQCAQEALLLDHMLKTRPWEQPQGTNKKR